MMAQERGPDGKFLPGDKPETAAPFVEVGMTTASAMLSGSLDPDAALLAMGLDPARWDVARCSVRKEDNAKYPGGVRCYTSVQAIARPIPLADTLPAGELLKLAKSWGKPAKARPSGAGKAVWDSLVVCLADWQVGGVGPGGNSSDTIDRVLALGDSVADRALELRAAGRNIDQLVVLGLGDLVEGCTGFYANQLFSVDLHNREQIRTTYMLITALLKKWAPLFPVVHVATIGGNHGQTREGGKVVTGPGDNKDVLAFEIVRDTLADLPGYGHLTWDIPDGELSLRVDVSGVSVGITHGDLFSGGANAAAKAERWWKGQVFGLREVADAKILFSGHFHHFSSVEWAESGRTWFQTPAMDNGSQWFTDLSGLSSAPGTLTMRVGKGCGPRLWDDLKIL
jgi:hypothetical protein